jgi:hypothetical protein
LLEVPGDKAQGFKLLAKPIHPDVLLRSIEKIFGLDAMPERKELPTTADAQALV